MFSTLKYKIVLNKLEIILLEHGIFIVENLLECLEKIFCLFFLRIRRIAERRRRTVTERIPITTPIYVSLLSFIFS